MKSKEKKEKRVINSTLGNLVEALYDSIPQNIHKTRQRSLLVAIALMDIRSRINIGSAKKLSLV